MENALIHRMRGDFDVDLGKVRFTYVERTRRGIFYFPMKRLIITSIFLENACELIDVSKKYFTTNM